MPSLTIIESQIALSRWISCGSTDELLTPSDLVSGHFEIITHWFAPKRLWQTIDKLLGREHAQIDKSISADNFNPFFNKKVADVRLLTADAGEPVFESTTHRLPSFSSVSILMMFSRSYAVCQTISHILIQC
jgi:hypothetical protein